MEKIEDRQVHNTEKSIIGLRIHMWLMDLGCVAYQVQKKWMLLTRSCPTFCDSLDFSPPASSVHGISQEYWSGLLFPFPGDLPNPEFEPGSPASQMSLYHLSQMKAINISKDYTEQPRPVASLVARRVKNLPATQETWTRSLGWKIA